MAARGCEALLLSLALTRITGQEARLLEPLAQGQLRLLPTIVLSVRVESAVALLLRVGDERSQAKEVAALHVLGTICHAVRECRPELFWTAGALRLWKVHPCPIALPYLARAEGHVLQILTRREEVDRLQERRVPLETPARRGGLRRRLACQPGGIVPTRKVPV
eukprot:937021-Prymnesium_polylepis.4